MNQTLRKQPLIRLEQENYRQLREQILNRDRWRCQFCGSMSNLEVHHQAFRSLSGEDTEQNRITLCQACHRCVHQSGVSGGYYSTCGYRTVSSYDNGNRCGASSPSEPNLITLCAVRRLKRREFLSEAKIPVIEQAIIRGVVCEKNSLAVDFKSFNPNFRSLY